MNITRIEEGSRLERITGNRPYIITSAEWYGKKAIVYKRVSDGRLFTVYPKGASALWLDELEAVAKVKAK